MSQEVISFVVRFVREASAQEEARWRGTIKHVQGASERQFTHFSEALAFMQAQLNSVLETAAQSRAAVSNPWLETARLWQDFAPQYHKLVIASLSETFTKGASLPAEVARSLTSAWAPSTEARSSEKLEAISRQLEELSATLTALRGELASLRAGQPERGAPEEAS